MLTALTWYWHQEGGRTNYRPWHVNTWADMVRRNCSLDIEVACVTDIPEGLDPSIRIIAPPPFEDVYLPTWDGLNRGLPKCLRRIAMFRPDAADIFGERFVSMDLDCVISGSLDPLFDRREDFVMYRGVTEKRPYNGSMVMMTAGARSRVYTEFTPERAVEAGQRYLGSDQAWISAVLGWGEATWGVEHGVHAWGSRRNEGESRLMFFLSSVKPWDLLDNETIAAHYRRDGGGGHALVLGHRPGVWQEARAALELHSFDAVLAYPDVAEKWPEDVDAIFESRAQAQQLVRAMGFDRVTECGVRSKLAA